MAKMYNDGFDAVDVKNPFFYFDRLSNCVTERNDQGGDTSSVICQKNGCSC